MIAHKSIMFIGPFMNFIFRGLQARRTKYSMVKNATVMTSMTLMIWRSRGNSTSPSSLYWSSSMVEMMNVKVDIKTIESEKNAQKLETRYKIFMDTRHVEEYRAVLLVQGYSKIRCNRKYFWVLNLYKYLYPLCSRARISISPWSHFQNLLRQRASSLSFAQQRHRLFHFEQSNSCCLIWF